MSEISSFVGSINALPNPFVYGLLYGAPDLPDIPVHVVPQFSQKGEDVIVDSIRRAICREIGDPGKRFTYLEIGANHPIAGSSTFLFYANGSRGTLAEANPRLAPRLRESRQGDTVVEAAVVAGRESTVDLYLANHSELSSMRPDLIESFEGAKVVERLVVPAINVNDLIATMWDSDAITFMSIDVEGLDFEILEAIDLDSTPFDIIQIEASEHLIAGNSRRIIGYLEQRGYAFVNETEVNLVFRIGVERQRLKWGTESRVEDLAGFGVVDVDAGYVSYDLFDTLIARRGVGPDSALRELRKIYGDLVDRRIALDDGSRTLRQIYEHDELPAEMMDDEIRLEIEQCVPIQRNIDRLRDGDLIISDTYLPRDVLIKLMDRAGISQRLGLYCSNLDKYNGTVWNALSELPILHLGDNEHSDYIAPASIGVKTKLVQDGVMTDWELALGGPDVELARLVREVRLRSRASRYPTWQLAQMEANVPMILAASIMVRRLEREPVFLGRDCQQLSKIHRHLFGEGKYLPFSRWFAHDIDNARSYLLENVGPDQVIVDLVSTGSTWAMLELPRDIHVIIESDDYDYSNRKDRPNRFSSQFRTSEIGPTSFIWEVLNCADHGMALGLGDLKTNWLRFATSELPSDFVREIHSVTKQLLISLENYDIEELIPDPQRIFLAAHTHLLKIARESPSIFEPISQSENKNIQNLVK